MDDFVSGAGPGQPAGGGDLAFIPLGGTGEIGMNLNLYRCDGKLLAVDCGIGFGGPDQPEVEIVVPDPGWVGGAARPAGRASSITHAHEDHVGAVAHLWPQLRCPIYAGPFVSAVLRRKLGEAGLNGQAQVTTVPLARPPVPAALRPANSSASRIRCRRRRRWPSAPGTGWCCTPATGSSTPSR